MDPSRLVPDDQIWEAIKRECAEAAAHEPLLAGFLHTVVLSQPEALKSLASASGLDAQQAEAAWGDTLWKARLKRANDEAIAAGVFDLVIVDGEPFWGNDRKAQIERWLAKGPF